METTAYSPTPELIPELMSTEVNDTTVSTESIASFRPRESCKALCEELSPFLISVRRHLRMNPEVGFHEHETSRYIRSVLEAHGLMPVSIATTGLYVDIAGEHDGPTARTSMPFRPRIILSPRMHRGMMESVTFAVTMPTQR